MNVYLEPQGFLGTGASLLADLTLLAYILLIVPGMIVGYIFARRGQHRPQHRNVMIGITVINWALIVFLMIVAYRFDVAENLSKQPVNPRYIVPTIHGILGLIAQLLATYVIYRMWREDSRVAAAKKRGEKGKQLSKYWFTSAKPFMWVTLILWLVTSVLGIGNYVIRYEVLAVGGGGAAPVATEEPIATDEPDVASTPDVVVTDEPLVTETVAPAATEEAATPAPVATDEPAATPEATTEG
jgi:uncharacterized membrane protein YozB (DUF420 family)